MSTDVEICNTALGHIGIDRYIADLNEASTEAKNCLLHYDATRRELLNDFPYNFARGVVALALLTNDPPPGWRFAYRYPTDCLQARTVSTEAGIRYRSGWASAYCMTWGDWVHDVFGRAPWEVMHDPDTAGSRRVVTDIEDAYLWYTVDVEQVSQFPPLFRNAFAWSLAAKLAGPLRVNANLRASAIQIASNEVSKAQASSFNESQPDRLPESPSIQVRC